MIHKSIYSFQSLFVQRNREKVVKAFFFKLSRMALSTPEQQRVGILYKK